VRLLCEYTEQSGLIFSRTSSEDFYLRRGNWPNGSLLVPNVTHYRNQVLDHEGAPVVTVASPSSFQSCPEHSIARRGGNLYAMTSSGVNQQ